MKSSRKQRLIRLIALVVVVISLTTLACSVTDKLFVDTEATNAAIQNTQEAQDERATERAVEKTQDALNEQSTRVSEQATQAALDAQATVQSMQLTQQAQQQQQQQNQSGGNSTFGSGPYTFYVVNDSTQTVCYLYMASSSSTEWGTDLLGSSTLAAGDTFTVSGVPADTYDLMATDCSGNELASYYGADVPANDTWTLYDTGTTSGGTGTGGTGGGLYVYNYSSSTICYLYISPSTNQYWGDDWLGSDVISTNTYYLFTNVPSNTYDLQAQDCSGNVIAEYYSFTYPTYDTWQVYDQ